MDRRRRQVLRAHGTESLAPTVRARHDIRINILLALQGNPGNLGPVTRAYDRNWNANAGGQATAKNAFYDGTVEPELQRKLLSHAFWCNRVNRAYVRRFLDLAARHHITVFWVLTPIAPALQQERERTGADAKHEQFVRSMVAQYTNVVVVDGRHSGYDHRVMIDPIHLDCQGASTMSADLADLVGSHVPSMGNASRWVPLPAFRDVRTEVLLEEIVDFNVAMRDQTGRRLR